MRKLVIFVSAFSLSTVLSVYLLSPKAVVISALICVLLTFGFIFFRDKSRSVYFISFVGLAVGFIYFFVYASVFTYPAQKYYGTSEEISAVVLTYPKDNSADVSIQFDGELNIRTKLYSSKGYPENTTPGDSLTAYVEFSENTTDYLYTSGVKLYAYTSEVTVTDEGNSIRHLGSFSSNYIKNLVNTIFPNNTAHFATALLTGDKSDFYEDETLVIAFENAGLSHIIAVSGMHLSFALTIPGLFVKNRRRFSLISIPCILFFMAFAGFTPSVCRSGIMYLCIALANLFNREPDSLTSLFTSVLLLILFDPYAAASISLQLSFASVLGIIMFADKICNKLLKISVKFPKVLSKLYRAVITIISVSVSALVFTTPLCAIYFGKLSVAAPIISVFSLCILSLTFCLCVLSCALGSVFLPAGIITAKIASVFLHYIMWVAKTASSSGIASVYIANRAVLIWLIMSYLVFIAIYVLNRPFKAYITPTCISVICLCLIFTVPKLKSNDTSFEVTVLDVGQGQSIVVTSEDMTAVIDCGNNSGEDAGKITSAYLNSKGIDNIDMLILTHYHSDHSNGVIRLISEIGVSALIIPPPDENTDYDDKILSAAEIHNITVVFIESDLTAKLGSGEISVYQPVLPTGENERCAAVLCTNNGFDVLITGDMPAYCELLLLEHAKLPDIEVLVAGHHGSSTSSSEALITAVKPESVAISVGDNSYGHPSDEILQRFAEHNIVVFRTDESGHITFN